MSSSIEEDMQQDGREGDDVRASTTDSHDDQGDHGSRHDDLQARRVRRRRWAGKIGPVLGMTPDAVIDAVRRDPSGLKARIIAAGLDPNTGDPVNGRTTAGRASALAAGIVVPNLGIDRLADRDDQQDDQQDRDVEQAVDQGIASVPAVA